MANEIDAHVGQRLRQRRWMLGLTQQQLGERIGIKFQQVQKYETGQNRISASRLWELSQATDVEISYFFEGLGGDEQTTLEAEGVCSTASGDLMTDREAIELVRAYYATPESQRRRVFELLKSLAGERDVPRDGDMRSTDVQLRA